MIRQRRSFVGVSTCFRLSWPMIRHPWIGVRLVALQMDKWFFPLLHPRSGAGRAGRIRQVGVRITDRCNLRCETCGQWGTSGFMHEADSRERRVSEVAPDRYIACWHDLVEKGEYPMVYLWGGEPMLYPGVLDVVESAADLRLPVSIATNGSRVAAAAERLARAPLFLLQVSIDGHTPELHNRIRPSAGGSDNFSAVLDALRAVRDARTRARGLPLLASLTTVSRHNARHLLDVFEAFHRQVDVMVFYLGWWIDDTSVREHEREFVRRFGEKPTTPGGWVGGWMPDDPHALAEEFERVERAARKAGTPIVVIPSIRGGDNLARYYTDHAACFGYDRCVAIYEAMEINSNGDISPCRDYHDYVVGNIKDGLLTEWWNHPRYVAFRRSLHEQGLMPVCTRCCGLMGY